jgi:hypothetical protein
VKQENHPFPFPFDEIVKLQLFLPMNPDEREEELFLVLGQNQWLKCPGVVFEFVYPIELEEAPSLSGEGIARNDIAKNAEFIFQKDRSSAFLGP